MDGIKKLLGRFTEIFGLGRGVAVSGVLIVALIVSLAAFFVFHAAPPTTLTITAGPEGSLFQKNALKYAAILARNGVKLKVLTSNGSLENLQRLQDPKFQVDLGYVQGGITNNGDSSNLLSLGSVFYEPMLVFYRSEKPIGLLSELKGKRLSIGPNGSGTRALALALLETNGITSGSNATFVDLESEAATKDLIAGKVDAAFFMADSASSSVLRQLLREPGIHLYDFQQADAYTRRIKYLNKLVLAEGSFDLGKNIPDHDIRLVGPTVEIVGRDHLHPALCDLLLDAAKEVHGDATILQRQGEFPAALERNFPINPDATRYYKSGRNFLYFLYRTLPFGIASLLSRMLVVLVPMIVVLIPILRMIPTVYRWRIRLRINRWYRALLTLERELASAGTADPAKKGEFVRRLDEIEIGVYQMKLPASFGDQFYGLRGHIGFVRDRLKG